MNVEQGLELDNNTMGRSSNPRSVQMHTSMSFCSFGVTNQCNAELTYSSGKAAQNLFTINSTASSYLIIY